MRYVLAALILFTAATCWAQSWGDTTPMERTQAIHEAARTQQVTMVVGGVVACVVVLSAAIVFRHVRKT